MNCLGAFAVRLRQNPGCCTWNAQVFFVFQNKQIFDDFLRISQVRKKSRGASEIWRLRKRQALSTPACTSSEKRFLKSLSFFVKMCLTEGPNGCQCHLKDCVHQRKNININIFHAKNRSRSIIIYQIKIIMILI